MLVLKLRCNKHSAYIERPTPPLIEEENKKSWSWISRRLKQAMTVLVRASSNLTDWKGESAGRQTSLSLRLLRDSPVAEVWEAEQPSLL
jgi:hypothetical protein